MAGTSYGLLAGTISDKAVFENVTVKNGQLLIDSSCYFGTDDYTIGLLCGMGSAPIDSDITCAAIGEGLWVSVEDGVVTLLDEAPAGAEVPAEEVPTEEIPAEPEE